MSTETSKTSPERENGPVQEERTETATAPVNGSPTNGSAADRRRWLALAIVMTAAFMDLVDVTIVNIAIPSMRQDLNASTSAIQWITAGYALAFAAGLITGGRLGDIYGRKRLFLIGIAGFTAASLLCGIAANPSILVASRLLQGGMAAMMVPQVLSIIHVTFPPHERGKVFGMFGAIVGLGAVSGPMLGALLTQWNLFGLEWRPIFLINLPVGIAGVILGRKFITESKAPNALRLDLIGVVLATAAMVMLIYPLTQGRENDWPLWGFLCMGAVPLVIVGFIAYEKHKIKKDGSPLVELSLFKVRSFAERYGRPAHLRDRDRHLLPGVDAHDAVGPRLERAARRHHRHPLLHRRLGRRRRCPSRSSYRASAARCSRRARSPWPRVCSSTSGSPGTTAWRSPPGRWPRRSPSWVSAWA